LLRGTAQNPDVFFQAREAINAFYRACPTIVQSAMDRFALQTGRAYHLFDYLGSPEADRVLVLTGSSAGAAEETVEYLNGHGEKVGILKVRLFRPFASDAFLAALPKSAHAIAVLDRTKEPGAVGEPMYSEIVTALAEARQVEKDGRFPQKVVGGRYGLSSKEFTPSMVKTVFDELKKDVPKNHFTVGINDDVTHTSLPYDSAFSTENPQAARM
jgi:pyruvate-ferredoxin/flavodoxin oxidoreductase